MKRNKIDLQVLLGAAAVLIAVELLAIVTISSLGWHPLLVIGIARAVEAVACLLIIKGWGGGLATIGLTRPAAAGMIKGLIWSTVFGGAALLFLGLLSIFNYDLSRMFPAPDRMSVAGVLILFVVGGLISPVAEEIFFRGLVFGFLRRWSAMLAIGGSTILFGMAHAVTSGVSLVQIAGGLVFAIAYEMEKDLLVPITIHILGNMAIFTLSFVLAV